jgi:UDP-N-acetylglucosamine 2-epimerase
LPEGKIFLSHLKNRNSNALVFANWAFAYNIKNPYNTKIEGRDLELAHGLRHKAYLKRHGIPEESIVIVGKESQDTISHFKNNFTRYDSLNILKIPEQYKIYIGFDANAVLRGYMASSEFMDTVNFLFEFVKNNPSCALVIKPHPSAKIDMLASVYKEYNLSNVFLLDKKTLPYHFLNAIDFLITKFSTLGFEAMEFGKPVISLILDREDNFKIYEDAADYCFEIESLNMLLTRLLNDSNYKEQWEKDHEGRRKKFLLYDRVENINPSEVAANEIDRRLRNMPFCK